MEIPATLFFLFWSFIQFFFLILAFGSLDKAPDLPISDKVMYFFKFTLLVSASSSSFLAVIFPPLDDSITHHLTPKIASYCLSLFGILVQRDCGTFLPVLWFIGFFILGHSIYKDKFNLCCFYITQLMTIGFVYFTSDHYEGTRNFSSTVSFFNLYCGIVISGGKRTFQDCLDPLLHKIKGREHILSIFKKKGFGELAEFCIGLLGTIVFQTFFKITSFNHILIFLYLSVSWLAHLVLSGQSSDFGVFNFLLSNVIVGCSVSQFGLGLVTWFAYAISVLLFVLRFMIEFLALVQKDGKGAPLVVWRSQMDQGLDYVALAPLASFDPTAYVVVVPFIIVATFFTVEIPK